MVGRCLMGLRAQYDVTRLTGEYVLSAAGRWCRFLAQDLMPADAASHAAPPSQLVTLLLRIHAALRVQISSIRFALAHRISRTAS